MITLVTKPTAADEIRAACIHILRDALAKAEAGEIDAVLLIIRHPDGRWSDERSGVMDFPDAIGRLEIVKQAWIRDFLGPRCPICDDRT